MQRLITLLSGLLLAAALTAPARAYTPENGVWWNPLEPGYGLIIEIQDDFLAAFVFSYDVLGNAQWYTATGFLTGNALFEGQLDAFVDGPCIGCEWRLRTPFGSGGPIRIAFDPDDETRATLTWGGGTVVPIERFHFYLKRPEDQEQFPGVPIALTKLLGEWQMVLDFTDNLNAAFQFYGDVLVLDRLSSDNLGDFVDGCRAADSLIGFCRDEDIEENYTVAEYVPSTGETIIVVNNDAFTYASYFVIVGTNDFAGDVAVYPIGSNPSVFFPVKGFRTASRSFVQDGEGPSKDSARLNKPPAGPLPMLAKGSVPTKQLNSDQLATLRRLEQRLAAKLAAR